MATMPLYQSTFNTIFKPENKQHNLNHLIRVPKNFKFRGNNTIHDVYF